ncbi:rubrerythrin family protein [bacterium]|nr:rubrerythrin family protein [bacterium]
MTKKKPEIKSWKNLESAFAGESMAYQKYLYFAKIARKNGDEEVAKLFEETAKHETKHAEGHLRNLYPMKSMTTQRCLELAVEGEKYEYTEMYPGFAKTAKEEGAEEWMVKEFEEGIEECMEHAEDFQKKLNKLSNIFQGLSKVEKEHHDNYERALGDFKAGAQFSESEDYLAKQED